MRRISLACCWILGFAGVVCGVRAPAAGPIEVVGAIGGKVTDVQVEGNIAYIARGANLEIEDVSDPENPKLLSRTHLPRYIDSFGQFKGAVYVAVPLAGFFIVDATDRSSPKIVDNLLPAGPLTCQADVIGNRLFVKSGYKSIDDITSYDLTNPVNPRRIGSGGAGIAGKDLLFYVEAAGDNESFVILEVLDAMYRKLGGTKFPVPRAYSRLFSLQYVSSSSRVYLTYDDFTFFVVDVTDPTWPKYLPEERSPPPGRAPTPESLQENEPTWGKRSYSGAIEPMSIFVTGTQALVADGDYGLTVLDVSIPVAPRVQGSVSLPGRSDFVVAKEDWAYVTQRRGEDGNGIHVVDFSNPEKPVLVRTIKGPSGKMALYQNFAYMADQNDGLRIFDIANPEIPKALGVYSDTGECSDVAIMGNRAVLAGPYRLRILSLENPVRPKLLAPGPAELENIQLETREPYRVYAEAVAVFGQRILAGREWCEYSGAELIDVVDIVEPVAIQKFKRGRPLGVNEEWAWASACEYTSCCSYFDLEFRSLSEETPVKLKFTELSAPPVVIAVEDLFYVADSLGGIIILRLPKVEGLSPEQIKELNALYEEEDEL